ncbi:MAG TPA: threonine synthase [Gemmatimonadaceae bacterium]|nr:threonine synthase [Gemmatimonadaceae bacterium]
MSRSQPDDAPAAPRLRCEDCAAAYPVDDARAACACGGLLDVEHALGRTSAAGLRAAFESRAAPLGIDASGVWRYREMVLPIEPARVVTFPEGHTPLLDRGAVSRWTGAHELLLKHEGLNPTGSFKDRGMTVAVTHALRVGATAVACASTGNTSSSLTAYAAIAGIPALVLVPDGAVAEGKLAQTLAYGARVLLVRGTFDDCLRLARQASGRLGVYLANSVNPWRVEGQKTIVLEMLEQLGWRAPDWIALPAGNLGNAAAFGKALREARAVGLIDRVPRLALVQAEGAAPFALSARGGFTERVRVERPETVASAIRIGNPASYSRAIRAVRETTGVVTTTSDAEILEAKAVIDASGTGCEPASAASVAGVRRLIREGVIAPGARIIAVLTGHLLKDPAAALGAQRVAGIGAGRGTPVEADLSAVEAALRDAVRGA